MQELRAYDGRTWTFEVLGFHLDAPQQAKSKVADEHEDVDYDDLYARVVRRPLGQSASHPDEGHFVAVVEE